MNECKNASGYFSNSWNCHFFWWAVLRKGTGVSLRTPPLSKNYVCPRRTDLAEIFRGHVSRPRQYTVKIWAQNIEVFKSYPNIKGQKSRCPCVPDFSSRSNDTDFGLVSQCSQHLPLQLNKAGFLKILFVYFSGKFFLQNSEKLGLIFRKTCSFWIN